MLQPKEKYMYMIQSKEHHTIMLSNDIISFFDIVRTKPLLFSSIDEPYELSSKHFSKKCKYSVSSELLSKCQDIYIDFNSLNENRVGTVNNLRCKLEEKNIFVSNSTMYKIMKIKKWKYCYNSSSMGMPQDYFDAINILFINQLCKNKIDTVNYIFFDESTFRLMDLRFNKRWVNEHNQPFGHGSESSCYIKLRLMFSFNDGPLYYEFVYSNLTSKEKCIKAFFQKCCKIIREKQEKVVMILDNNTQYKTFDSLSILMKEEILSLLFIPPRQSQFNLIEYVFLHLKQSIRKATIKNLGELKTKIGAEIKDFNGIKSLRKRWIKTILINTLAFKNSQITL